MMKKVSLKIKRISGEFNDLPLPKYETDYSSGMDLRAALENSYILEAGKVGMVPTGISMEIPLGYEVQVRPRSGLAAKHGIGVLNSPGTIDADYRGEVKVILFNFSDTDFVIKRGDRIAQMIIAELIQADITEVDELTDTVRGAGGFGHTGKN